MQQTPQPRKGKTGIKRRSHIHVAKALFVLFLTLILLAGIGSTAYGYYLINNDFFYPGVSVDGIELDGLTPQQAAEAICAKYKPKLEKMQMTIVFDGETWVYDHEAIHAKINVEETLENAYRIGRTGNVFYRLNEIQQARKNGKSFDTLLTFEPDALLLDIEQIAREIAIEPVDATITYHNKQAELFTFTPEVIGRKISVDNTMVDIRAKVKNWDFTPYEMQVETLYPKITLDEVKTWTSKLVTHHTVLYGTPERIHNITLSSASFDGIRIEPGELFSLNEATGPRGLKDGYKNAPVIVKGIKLADEPGGGNCQTSTTLYGAVIRADLKIEERWHHSWPSSYTEVAQDAMVDYPSADLKIKNNHDTPVFISRTISGNKIEVTIYGKAREGYDRIEVLTEITSTTDKPAEKIVNDANLFVGETVVEYASRPGIKAQSFRVYYKDGVEVKRVFEAGSSYRRIEGQKRVGTKPLPVVEPVDPPVAEPPVAQPDEAD